MTYAELHDYARRMAGWLASAGISSGDRLIIWAPNSPWWVVAFWGAILRGVIVVPIDFAAGFERSQVIVRLTSARLAIQSKAKGEAIAGVPSLFIEDLPHILAEELPFAAIHAAEPSEIAELIYTSGTTGAPKGVILTHGNLMANLMQVNSHIPVVSQEYQFLSCLPLSHMFEQMGGLFIPLSHGSSIVYLRTIKPSALMEAFSSEDIHAVIVVPRLLQLLKNSIERELAAKGLAPLYRSATPFSTIFRKLINSQIRNKFGTHFQLFVSGGSALSQDLFRFWADLGFRVVEGYGLTECSPVLAANTFDRQTPGSVGLPLPGVEVIFEEGELLVRGENISPGYYENEEATNQAFMPGGWFRTGDLGESDANGFIHLRGRRKELIVTGAGINVYPDEIEELLNKIQGVREACVIGFDKGEGEEVHAVLIPDGSGRMPIDIIQEANARLDDLQRITGFSLWPEADFPKTTTMKVQKYLVKKLLVEGMETATLHSEDRLTAIVAKITGSSPDLITEDALLVATLGLTSLGKLELVNVLEQEFRLDLDDALIGPQTKISDLRALVSRRDKRLSTDKFRSWPNTRPVQVLREVCDYTLHFPLLDTFVVLEVSGIEHLSGVKPPVLFVANHVSYLDQPTIMRALPKAWRYNTATAVWAEFFFKNFRNVFQKMWKRFTYDYGSVALNLFPLPQSYGFRSSLVHMGGLVDRGRNILVFPEGERSATGEMLTFKEGLGIMVTELDIPVVPIKIKGLERVFPRGAGWPKRGIVTVVFGKPLRFGLESPHEIVEISRKAIEIM
jgi:long-chain acyl-CoA synthetase